MGNVALIEDGLTTYDIANKAGKVYGRFSFNPSDMGILRRYQDVVKSLEEMDFNSFLSKDKDGELNIEAFVELEDIVCEKFNYLFGEDVSKEFFAVMSPLSPLPSGQLYLASALNAVGQAIEKETGARVKKMNTIINKHTSKYHR